MQPHLREWLRALEDEVVRHSLRVAENECDLGVGLLGVSYARGCPDPCPLSELGQWDLLWQVSIDRDSQTPTTPSPVPGTAPATNVGPQV